MSTEERRATGGVRAAVIAYAIWTVASVGIPLARSGLSADNRTLLHALLFLLLQLATLRPLRRLTARLPPRSRFVAVGLFTAAVIEGLHMTGMPVFASLRVDPTTSAARCLASFALDLAFTLPAYVAIFATIWFFIARYRYSLWQYVPLFGAGQALGDGLFFFLGAPFMLAFLPFPMLKYHAMNVLPFLLVRDELPIERRHGPRKLLAPLALVALYLLCGAAIKLVGRAVGLE